MRMTTDFDSQASQSADITIDFKRSGNSGQYRASGWSGSETDFTWSIGPQSFLIVDRFDARENVVIELDVQPLRLPPLVKGQVLDVHVNGRSVGCCRLAERRLLRFDVSSEALLQGQRTEIRFDHPCFARPKLLGVSEENRPLAVCFYRVRLFCEKGADASAASRPGLSDRTVASFPSAAETTEGVPRIYCFGPLQAGSAVMREGWHVDAEGIVWTGAQHNRLESPAPRYPNPYLLRLHLAPLCLRQLQDEQRLTILVEGYVVGQFRLRSDTCLLLQLPPCLYQDAETISISFVTPDGIPIGEYGSEIPDNIQFGFVFDEVVLDPAPPGAPLPNLTRSDELESPSPLAVSAEFQKVPLERLPVEIEAFLGVDPTEMLRWFESLGDNCGFGLAQRKAGLEVLGLLRFASTPLPALLRGLRDDFKATTIRDEITLGLDDTGSREYMLHVKRYGIRWHTRVYEGSAEADDLMRDQSIKLGYLRRKFYEGLRGGRKIHVIARSNPRRVRLVVPTVEGFEFRDDPPEPLRLAEVLPIYLEMNRYGQNTILYVVPASDRHPSGSVELVAPGIMRGRIASFVISEDIATADHAEWLRVIANAMLLAKSLGMTFTAPGEGSRDQRA
jgi:hypothetical protein